MCTGTGIDSCDWPALLTLPTGATGLAGICWIHRDRERPRQRRRVGNKGAELEEPPTVQHAPVASANRCPGAFKELTMASSTVRTARLELGRASGTGLARKKSWRF
jgi:hypothetical protein